MKDPVDDEEVKDSADKLRDDEEVRDLADKLQDGDVWIIS